MNKHIKHGGQASTGRATARSALRLSATAVAASLLAGGAGLAFAQQTVEITGIRRGIESAISLKKSSDNIVEAVSAEDIGKLPDTSIAESVARLPGVAAQRTAGRAQQISIRGMAPDFSTALLNGREQVTTGDSRGVEFDQYPSELLSSVLIYKTPDGGLVGQGLSGTIDLRTVRPLDLSKRTVAVNYREQKLGVGTLAEGSGSRFNLSYIDQFADRTLGIALGFARLDETGPVTSRFDNWGGGDTTYQGAKVNVPYNGFGYFADQTTQKRDGAMAVLQYKPNKSFSSTVDLFYSKFDKVKATKGFQAPLNDSWAGGDYDKGGVLSAATIASGTATAGTFNNVRAVIRNDAEATNDKLTSIGWNNQLQVGADWRVNADLSHSEAKRHQVIIETTAGTTQSTLGTARLDSIAFTNNASFTPALNYTDRSIIKLTDVQGWGGGTGSPQAGYTKLPTVNDDLSSYRLSAKRDLGGNSWLSAVEFGVNESDREKSRSFTEGRLVIKGGGPLASADIPGTGTISVAGLNFAAFDPSSAIGSIYNVVGKLHPDIYNKDWRVNEKVTTFYSKGDIDTKLMGLPVRGNVGVQVVSTRQSSVAFNVDKGTCTSDQNCPAGSITAGDSYTDVLPSLNLAFDLGNDSVMRMALARVMARPTINDMRASLGFGVDNGLQILKGDAGNPKLKPFRANAFDLSYEKYFGTKAYVGAAVFYKELNTYILRQDIAVDFTPFISPSTPLPPGRKVIGLLNMPTNGSGGSIKGVELTASLPLNMATPALDGFGIQASYSDTSSSINLATAGFNNDGITSSKIPLPGLSKQVAGFTVYFEKFGFSARVAARHRSNFVGDVTNIFGDRQLTYVKQETITDLQLGYEVQSGPAKGLSILFQANNVFNTPFIRFKDTPANVIEKVTYGKSYLLGANYKF